MLAAGKEDEVETYAYVVEAGSVVLGRYLWVEVVGFEAVVADRYFTEGKSEQNDG